MVATSGDVLMEKTSQAVIRETLLPLATVVTPNLFETEVLLERDIRNIGEMDQAAKDIVNQLGANTAVAQGGQLEGEAVDVFHDGEMIHDVGSGRLDTPHAP